MSLGLWNLSSAQRKTPVLIFNMIAWSTPGIPTDTTPLMTVVLSKWSAGSSAGVLSPTNQGLQDTDNWNWTQIGKGQYNGSIELMVRWNEGPRGFDGGLKLKNSL